MVIEDDKKLNSGLCKVLKSNQWQIVSFINLKAARDQFLCQTPDLILYVDNKCIGLNKTDQKLIRFLIDSLVKLSRFEDDIIALHPKKQT